MNSLLSQGFSYSTFHQLGLLTMPALHSATQTDLCHSHFVSYKGKQSFARRYKYRQKHLHFCRTSKMNRKRKKSYLNLQKEEKWLSSVLKRNVENKKSLSLHNSQLSGDSPMLHLVSKEDIVGKRKSKIWLFYRVQGNICRSFHVIGWNLKLRSSGEMQ